MQMQLTSRFFKQWQLSASRGSEDWEQVISVDLRRVGADNLDSLQKNWEKTGQKRGPMSGQQH